MMVHLHKKEKKSLQNFTPICKILITTKLTKYFYLFYLLFHFIIFNTFIVFCINNSSFDF